MSTKEEVLRLLNDSHGAYLSGEELARKLNVSRNAVWRAVKALQSEGCTINAVTNKGYCMMAAPQRLSLSGIGRYLHRHDEWDVEVFQTIDSTNTALKELAEKGVPEGKIYIAAEQTAGRGRMGRSFYSPSGTGVYLSLLLRPTFSPEQSLYITTAAAVAVAEAIETVSDKKAQIKWVNDVYVDGKKVCGILTEAAFDMESRRLAYAVPGIGINLCAPEGGFPDELKAIVGSVFDGSTYTPEKRDRLTAEVVNRFWDYYINLTDKAFLKGYQERSLLHGQEVYVINGDTKVPAVALDIDDEFRLCVQYPDGRKEYLRSGEVSVKPRQVFDNDR